MTNIVFAETPETPLEAGSQSIIFSGNFWPIIELKKIRESGRIDESVTAERLYYAASAAVLYVNSQLAVYRAAKEATGISAMANSAQSAVEQINGTEAAVYHYTRAVISYTKAELLETYADFDATGHSAERAAAKQAQADDYRREAHAAIADIIGTRRVDSELI